MRSFRFLHAAFVAPVLLGTSLAHALAAPEPSPGCGEGPACGFGFECAVVGSSGCAPTPSCAPGASCPEPEPCASTPEYGCVPAGCAEDAECATGMVCHEWSTPCAASDCACAPGEVCDCGGPTTCETVARKVCTPRYLLPCEAATDCGTGFTCEATESCGCSGSAGSEVPPSSGSGAAPLPPPGEDADPAPVPPDCTCEPSGVKQCVPREIECEADAACPAGWTCEPGNAVSLPACDSGDCAARPAPTPPASKCQPPYYGNGGGNLGAPTTPEASGGGGKGTPTSSGGDEVDRGEEGPSNESSACQFGAPSSSPGPLGWLALFGTLLGAARRRAFR